MTNKDKPNLKHMIYCRVGGNGNFELNKHFRNLRIGAGPRKKINMVSSEGGENKGIEASSVFILGPL